MKVITEWVNGFNVIAEPKEEELFTSHRVNGQNRLSPGESVSHLHLFMKEKGHRNYISIASEKVLCIPRNKRDCKSPDSLPLHDKTTPTSLLGKGSVAEDTSCLLVSILLFLLNKRLHSVNPVNRLYLPVSCAAPGVAVCPSSDQRGVNWGAAWGSVGRLTKRSEPTGRLDFCPSPFIFLAFWNRGVMAGAPAAVLHHEVGYHRPGWRVTQKQGRI